MAIPDYQSIVLPLLRLAGDGQEHAFRETVTALAEQFGLTTEERGAAPSEQDATAVH